jgi:alpha-tubulin suppressor-like RCC1 family protein
MRGASPGEGDRCARCHTCALTDNGGVRCWGWNEAGQLGDGTTTNRWVPPKTDAIANVQAIAAGGSNTCALMMNGGVRCWGADTLGQLGDGTREDRWAPPTSDVFGPAQAVGVGHGRVCTLTAGGDVF